MICADYKLSSVPKRLDLSNILEISITLGLWLASPFGGEERWLLPDPRILKLLKGGAVWLPADSQAL